MTTGKTKVNERWSFKWHIQSYIYRFWTHPARDIRLSELFVYSVNVSETTCIKNEIQVQIKQQMNDNSKQHYELRSLP